MFPQIDLFSRPSSFSDRDQLRPHRNRYCDHPRPSLDSSTHSLSQPSSFSYHSPPPPTPLPNIPPLFPATNENHFRRHCSNDQQQQQRQQQQRDLGSGSQTCNSSSIFPFPSVSIRNFSSPASTASSRTHFTHRPDFAPRRHHPRLPFSTSTSSSTETDLTMARPTPAQRPSYIALPTPSTSRSGAANGSLTNPNSPLPTPPISRTGGGPEPLASPTSPRTSFLGSFMRTRSRAATVTNAVADAVRGRVGAGSPTVERPNPLSAAQSRQGESHSTDGGGVTRSISTPLSGGTTTPVPGPGEAKTGNRTYRIRLVPHLETNRSLHFDPVIREMAELYVPPGILPANAAGAVTNPGPHVNGRLPALLLKIGRFTDRPPSGVPAGVVPSAGAANGGAAGASANGDVVNGGASGASGSSGGGANASGPIMTTNAGGGGDLCSNRVAFKSKVVSRAHAEIWCAPGGKFFIRDTASSSGTFLNHIRLSSPNVASQPMELKDGDVLQLGIDYQNRQEDLFRCVKLRVELGREWQRGANEFNTNAFKQLKALGAVPEPEIKAATGSSSKKEKSKASVTDCCICLFSVTVCQSLFIAPCSHVFHYKCIRPLLLQHHPGFSCPLCRTFANLEEDVETEDAWEIASRRASVISRRASNHSIRLPSATDGPATHPPEPEGEMGTSIGFGASIRSIDELLAESGTGSGSGRTSEDAVRTAEGEGSAVLTSMVTEDTGTDEMSGSSALARQTTVVPASTETPIAEQASTGLPAAPPVVAAVASVPAPEEILSVTDGDISGSLAVLADPSRLENYHEPDATLTSSGAATTRAAPININLPGDPSTSDTQTPMNEVFLSTLAPGLDNLHISGSQAGGQQQAELFVNETSASEGKRRVDGNQADVLDEVREVKGHVEDTNGDSEPLIGGSGRVTTATERIGHDHADTMYT